jgi:hypothetical protein
MKCHFHADFSYSCNISGTARSNASYYAGSYFINDDTLSLHTQTNETLCLLVQKTFNELQASWSRDNVCTTTTSQCPTATSKANIQTFDLFGPGLSSFELFGILVGASAIIVVIAVIAEACRSKMAIVDEDQAPLSPSSTTSSQTNYSPLKFFVLAMGMTISGFHLYFFFFFFLLCLIYYFY